MTGTDAEKRSPSVLWAERKNLLYLFIQVTDSKSPEINLTADKLFFRGKDDEGKLYEVTLEFYKDVNPETSKYSVRDRGIDFVLMKAEEGPYWNRLLKDNKKHHWLRIDFNKWRDEDDSDIDINNEEDFEEETDTEEED
ncbi:Protein wos2, partial [Stegodyphus mimosarum]